MGGNACKRYGVTRLSQLQYEKIRNIIYLVTSTRVTPIESFVKESHGDIDFVAFRSDKGIIERIFNTSDSVVHLGQVENGNMMTSYALEIDVDKKTRTTAQIDILWVDTSSEYHLSRFIHSWNGFIIYFLNERLRNINPNLTLNAKGLTYKLELRKTKNSNVSEVQETYITDDLDTILSMCGLSGRDVYNFRIEEDAFRWLNRSPLHTKNEFKYTQKSDIEVVNNYFAWNEAQPETEVDELAKKRVESTVNRVLSVLPNKIRRITKLFKTENYYKSLVKFNRVRKIENYLLRTYFLNLGPLSNEEIGWIIKSSIPKISTKANDYGEGHSRKLHDQVIKSELVKALTTKLCQREGII